ncbi:ABC-F family ATP-binding cassette domain-containing protein [Rothia halotolerans]|uniref:ABC-F family ATP-binding cassette domain-containing protein n=1 Tax=Rothia halotolerans TaxID=405770 RepID=UPI00101C6FEA|nr:ATP-binding cassette domain-containing protein [Rothia halotolerans]
MAHLEIASVTHSLPGGRPLLRDISLRVGEGEHIALIGANGAGKSTLLRIVTGEITPDAGAVTRHGSLGVLPQTLAGGTVADLLLSVAPPALRRIAADLEAARRRLEAEDSTSSQMAYASALTAWGEAGGYDAEVLWDACSTSALGLPYERSRERPVSALSGGERKRLALEALLHGPDELLLLDEPDNSLDLPGTAWLEERLAASGKSVLYVSHDRELLARTADGVVSLELGAAGSTAWTHAGGFATFHEARRRRFERLDELRRRWEEEREKLRALVRMYKQKAAYNSDMTSRYRAARTRLARFEEEGPPQAQPREQRISMRLRGGRTGRRVLTCESLELTGLMRPFDAQAWFGDRIAVLGSNGSGKSHFLQLLAGGGSDPAPEHAPASGLEVVPVPHTGTARLGARVRPGWFAQTHGRPDLSGRTLLDILHRGDEHRPGLPREEASRALARYELAAAAEQDFDELSGGQRARLQILLLELAGATLLLLDEPTDNLDLESAHVLQEALRSFEGTVLAVTHDRWFARDFERFWVFGSDGRLRETREPVWDEGRVRRERG